VDALNTNSIHLVRQLVMVQVQVMMWCHSKMMWLPSKWWHGLTSRVMWPFCSSNSTDLLLRLLCWCNFLSRLMSRPTSPHWVNHLSSMTLGAIIQGAICSCTQQLLPGCQSWSWWLILPTGTLVDSVLVNACMLLPLKLLCWSLSDVVKLWWCGAPVTALLRNQ